jgi:N-acetyl-gamma-glutamyl-phosphate reductase
MARGSRSSIGKAEETMAYTVFIDGQEGATGLKICERFAARDDIRLLTIDPARRKDIKSRLDCMAAADVIFLCLPDDASREIMLAADALGGRRRVIDASTAFRTAPDWVYGLPELRPGQREKIRAADKVAVPGCHATGFILLAYPLIHLGIVGADYPFCCHSVTGFSGGGKKMIAAYAEKEMRAPRQYGLSQTHKHLPEMEIISGTQSPVLFDPIVADYYSGMLVTTPLHPKLFQKKADPWALYEAFAAYYRDQPMIRVLPPGEGAADGFLPADALAGRNDAELLFYGRAEYTMLAARYDNLGKGASGGAIQCMNLMLGLPEETGLL